MILSRDLCPPAGESNWKLAIKMTLLCTIANSTNAQWSWPLLIRGLEAVLSCGPRDLLRPLVSTRAVHAAWVDNDGLSSIGKLGLNVEVWRS